MSEDIMFMIKIIVLMVMDFGFGVMFGYSIWGRRK